MKKHIPNIITSLNLLVGCIGIYYVTEVNLYLAALLVFVAAIFDFLDGFTARLLKAYSPVGKSLDSLADLVSFGILPGLLLINLQLKLVGAENVMAFVAGLGFYRYLLILSPLLIPLASAIRLAIFDNDLKQSHVFRGLPTPANAIFIAALILAHTDGNTYPEFIFKSHSVLAMNIILAYLLISPLSFISLKFRNYQLKDNIARYLVIFLFSGSIIIWKISGIMIGMSTYLVISFIADLVSGRRKRDSL